LSRVELPPVNHRPMPDDPETRLTPEPLHRGNQIYIEAALKSHLEGLPGVEVRFGWRLAAFEQDDGGVAATIVEVETGREEIVRAAYLAGCDGGQSLVRRTLGIGYEGKGGDEVDFMMGRMLAVHYRAPAMYELMKSAPPWQYQSMNPDGRASIIALDGAGSFLTHAKMPPGGRPDDATVKRFIRDIVGHDIPLEIISAKPWTAGLSLLAECYHDRRVALVGDAVHLFTPTGGFGMNTGNEDAANLGWKLAACHHGWGGAGLLASYETERRPIGRRNLAQSYAFAHQKSHLRVPGGIEDATPRGERIRAALGAEMVKLLSEEFLSIGIQLGARYDGSPIIAGDGSEPPPDRPFVYVPSACPGGRAPHAWLGDGSALFDHFGPGFTLLALGVDRADRHPLEQAAADRGVPLRRFDAPVPAVRDTYEADFVLIRPDQHVAWRGNARLADAGSVIDRVTGRDRAGRKRA
jgi:2-polyprenyl-6-methoxyphenol hydroxylase-like FAD-dependent oxidoreductase